MPTEAGLQNLRDVLARIRRHFAAPIDCPWASPTLGLEERSGDVVRMFKHLHQQCFCAAIEVRVANAAKLGAEVDTFLLLSEQRRALGLYLVTRALMEHAAFIAMLVARLREKCAGDRSDWRTRGEGFFKLVNRARLATGDSEREQELTAKGVPKSAMETFHANDSLKALAMQPEFQDCRAVYGRLCDYVHHNGPSQFVGSPGHFFANRLTTLDGREVIFAEPTPANRFSFPAPERCEIALADTVDVASRCAMYSCDTLLTPGSFPPSPYGEEEILAVTRTSHGTTYIEFSKLDGLGPYDPCPCGSGKKFKFCCEPRIRRARPDLIKRLKR